MIHLREQYWAYPMPINAEGAEIRGEHPGRPYQLLSFYGEADAVDLPPGNWKIVCTSKEVTEEQAAGIVEQDGIGYRDYAAGPPENDYGDFVLSSDSLDSLLFSKQLDPDNNNYLILKKQ